MMATQLAKKPGVSVRVLYDYEYTNAHGTKISIKMGEQCLLLKKSTGEWWSVLRTGEKKPIYVPANYVEEVKKEETPPVPAEKPKKKGPPPKPPVKPKPKPASVAEDEALKELDEVINSALDLDMIVPDENTFDDDTEPEFVDSFKPDLNENEPCYDIPIPVRGQDSDEEPPPDYDLADASPGARNEETTLRSTCSTGDSAIGSQDSLDNEVPNHDKIEEELPDYANMRDLGIPVEKKSSEIEDDGPDYANLSDIQAVIHSQSESVEDSSALVRKQENDWQLRQDNKTKKYFRYHQVSNQILWNDPRESPVGSLDRKSTYRDSTVSAVSAVSADVPSLPSPLPSGWREENTDGEVFLVNDVTEEKWRCAVDATGRTYYYRKESGETVWELPEVSKRHSSLDSRITDDQRKSPDNKTKRASWSVGDSSILRKIPPPLARLDGSVIQEEDESQDRASSLYESSPPSTAGSTLTRVHEKKGFLYKTKSTENGKKIKKNWSQSFVVLRGAGIYFYKDQKATQPSTKNPAGKFEFSIGLRGCKVIMDGKDRSSKKHVMVLLTSGGVEFLLQDASAQGVADWCKAIAGNITSSMVSLSGSVNSLDDLNMEAVPTVLKPQEKMPQRPSTPDDLLPTGEKNSKFKDWINKWLKNRPSYESLQQKGYIKDGVFGSHLQTLYERTNTNVPVFVCCCLEAIENRGLKVDGIYRVSGNLAQIQKLRFLVDKDEHYDLMNPEWDIHVVSGALKLFFREMREPLFPFTFFDKFIESVQIKDRSKKLKTFKDLIKLLPTPNRETLRVLCTHLNRVIEHSRVNRMQLQNIAIVFGPTLMWPATESQNLAISLVYQGQCIEFIIQEQKALF